ANTRDELANAEGLGEVIVGAALETEDLVRFLAPRGQHQNRHIAVQRLAAHGPAHGDAVELRQHHVEDQQVERIGFREPQAGGAVTGRDRGQPFELQMQYDQIPNVRVVFHDEYAAARLPIAARVSSWCHRSSLPKSARPGAVPWFYHSAAIVLSPGGAASCDPAWRRGLPPSLKLRR